MKVIAINGSPGRDGNVAYLLNLVLEGARNKGVKTELLHAHEIMIGQKRPYCYVCSNPCSGKCYRGTELEAVFRKMEEADAIILGSPVYFGTVSAQLKAFWDKSRRLRVGKKLVNKVGAAVSCGGGRFGGQETTIKALHDMLMIQGMTVVGDGTMDSDAGHQGVCAQKPSREDEVAHKRARILSQRVVETASWLRQRPQNS